MKRVARLLAFALTTVLACAAAALAGPPAGAAFTPIARSSLVAVEGVMAGDTLVLRLKRAADQQPLTGAELAVTLDGRSLPVTARPEGTWGVPLKDPGGKSAGRLAIVVAHDGVREVLDGQLPGDAPAVPAAGTGSFASALIHKQMAWWILNIVIVLIGVIAVSRRTSGGG
jgi:hypothetical protein